MQVNRPYGFGQGETISDTPLVEIVTPTDQTPERRYALSWDLFTYQFEEGQAILPGVYELTSLQQREVGDSVYSFGDVLYSNQPVLYLFNYGNYDPSYPEELGPSDENNVFAYLSTNPNGAEAASLIGVSAKNKDTQENLTLTETTIEGFDNARWKRFINGQMGNGFWVDIRADLNETDPVGVFSIEYANYLNINVILDLFCNE